MSWYTRSKLGFTTLKHLLSPKTPSQNPLFILQNTTNNLINNPFKVSNSFLNNPFRVSNYTTNPFNLSNFSNQYNNPFRVSNYTTNPFKLSSFSNRNTPFRVSNYTTNPFKLSSFSNRNTPFRVSNFSSNRTVPFRVSNVRFSRSYYVDSRQVKHFKPRGFKSWFENPRHVMICLVVGTGVVVTVYFGNVETIPYTKRKHLVLLTRGMERNMGESQFQNLKEGFKGRILPAMHPESVRVRMISNDIIESLQRGLKKEQVWTDLNYASESGGASEKRGKEAVMAMHEESVGGGKWLGKDEVMDDVWVDESRRKGRDKGDEAALLHLEGVKWEVLVVNDPLMNAFCLPGGKIVVFTGLLDHFRTDEELATIIGHEVAHCVARHSAEQITKNLWFTIAQLILYQFVMPDLVNTMSNLLLRLPFSRRMEIEADYIGLLLMASAGYDPRVAPKVFEKMGQLAGDSALENYISTHPSGKRRSKLLSEANVMQEALSIYREAVAGREVDGFFL